VWGLRVVCVRMCVLYGLRMWEGVAHQFWCERACACGVDASMFGRVRASICCAGCVRERGRQGELPAVMSLCHRFGGWFRVLVCLT
jgi:hypothetical protein